MKAVKIQFRHLGKKYHFSCENLELKEKDYVVAETIRGLELGQVVSETFEITDENILNELKPIIRIATNVDLNTYKENKELEKRVLQKTKEIYNKLKLPMKVLSADYTLDKSKLNINFESEDRVDFRELVKELADQYKTRIELRQVGSRDGAKIFGGLGPCGLIVCCKTFLSEFDNVSIKMAKNQNLSLNPIKISGTCGKLFCCIAYENELYKELRQLAPDVGQIILTEQGEAKVLNCDVLNKTLKVKFLSDDRYGYLVFKDIVKIIDKKNNQGLQSNESS